MSSLYPRKQNTLASLLSRQGGKEKQKSVNKIDYLINDRNTITTYYPIAASNRQPSEIIKIIKINLPENIQTLSIPEYVFTMIINFDFCEFEITSPNNGIITGDINTANSYYFKSNFVNDTTWTPEILPQSQYTPSIIGFIPSCQKCNLSSPDCTTTFEILYDQSNKFYYLKITLQSNIYVVGTLNVIYGDIYPSEKVTYGNFNFTFEHIQ
jgi:hypothetical protein